MVKDFELEVAPGVVAVFHPGDKVAHIIGASIDVPGGLTIKLRGKGGSGTYHCYRDKDWVQREIVDRGPGRVDLSLNLVVYLEAL